METQHCPRCGVVIPPDATWEREDGPSGYAPAWVWKHPRPGANKRKCAIRVGQPPGAREAEREAAD